MDRVGDLWCKCGAAMVIVGEHQLLGLICYQCPQCGESFNSPDQLTNRRYSETTIYDLVDPPLNAIIPHDDRTS